MSSGIGYSPRAMAGGRAGSFASKIPQMYRATLDGLAEDPIRKARWDFMSEGLVDSARQSFEISADNMVREGLHIRPEMIENSKIMKRFLWEAMTAADVTPFVTQSIILMRHNLPDNLAFDLAGTIPTSTPTVKAFTIDHFRETGGAGATEQNFRVLNRSYARNNTPGSTIVDTKTKIRGADISANTDKVKSVVPIEVLQDLQAYHSIDAHAEMLKMNLIDLRRQSNGWLYLEFLNANGFSPDQAYPVAGTKEWNAAGFLDGDKDITLHRKAYDATIFDAIVDVERIIGGLVYQRVTDLLVGLSGQSRLTKLESWSAKILNNTMFGSPGQIVTGNQYLQGSVANRFNLWVDPDFPEVDDDGNELILCISRSGSPTTSGTAFCPYMMDYVSPEIDDLTGQRGRYVMNRYGMQKLNPDYYGIVKVTNPSGVPA